MEPYDSDALSTDGLVDELMPGEFDWRGTVRKYPLASLAVAAVGGYILGRTRGTDVLAALGLFAADRVAGQVNDLELINDQIARLPAVVPATAFVSSDGLKAMDRWHFDARSMKLLGRRYAEAMLKLHAAREAGRKKAPGGR